MTPSPAPSSRNPFALRGTISPKAYLGWGVALFAIKYALDAALVRALFDREWAPWFYWSPLDWHRVYPAEGTWHHLLFSAAALPFLWMGVGLTMRRLRDAGIATAWLVLFVVPPLNLLFFLALALLLPSKQQPPKVLDMPPAALIDRPIAVHMILANLIGLAIVALTFVLSVYVASQYGLVMFLGAPFLHGFCVAMWVVPRGFTTGGAIGTALAGIGIALLLAAGGGLEGMACIAMSLPLVAAGVGIGAAIGGAACERPMQRTRKVQNTALLLLLGPATLAVEHALAPDADVHEVVSSVDIAAAPEQVWPLVVAFPALPQPEEFLFRIGIAYPTSARIDGEGEGAVRHCTFNTGSFVEPITVWDPPHRLAFEVVESPQPMIEWNPFHDHVDAPHLHGFFRARHGEFRLEPLPDGGTRLVGTTWYSHGLRPEGYWRLWSDLMVHHIHARVLEHIQAVAEGRR